MSRIVDNESEKMYDVLKRELSSADEIAIASAYFNIGGFGLIKDSILDKPLKFLVGRPQDESISFEEAVVRELEENEDDPEYYNLMNEAVEYFSDPMREVRKKNGPFFHGKAYLGVAPGLNYPKNGVGIVGSSNFTHAGLKTNNELNVVNTDRELLKDLSRWFLDKWNSADDYKETFLSFLKNYTVTHTPYEVISKALYEYYHDDLSQSENLKIMGLKRFQVVSVIETRRILSQYNGVVIADSTGLGKTRTMIALAHEARREGKKVLLIAPKSVLLTTWEKEMSSVDTHIERVNSESISSDPDAFLETYSGKGYNFILVDEAHYFKSSASNRYKALRDFVLRNSAQIVLATATPVNNSLMDLYNLISLYADEDSIMDITGLTLKGYFTSNQKVLLEGGNIEMSQVLERFVVRHSRRFAKMIEKDLKFPDRYIDNDPLDKYTSNIDYGKLSDLLDGLRFAVYEMSVDKLSDLRLPTGQAISQFKEKKKKEDLKDLIKTIVILNMFKRLESSLEAFRETLSSLSNYMKVAMDYASKTGYFLPRVVSEDSLFDLDSPANVNIFDNEKFSSLKERCYLSDDEKQYFIGSCKEDIAAIEGILKSLPLDDVKMMTLQKRLKKLIDGMKEPNGVVIFTQYTATAKKLYSMVKGLYNYVYLTTGSKCIDHRGRDSDTTSVVGFFQEHGGILISTDVLSEGQNLQNAQYVVNYDFPWNPVVLIQRVGRIDRMGSKHDRVFLINVLQENNDPEDPNSLQKFIDLMGKLYTKIGGIKSTIGIDAPVLGEDADPKDFGRIQNLIASGKSDILSQLESEFEQFTNDPKDRLMEIREKEGNEWLEKIPRGIGAIKEYNRSGLFSLFTDGINFYWRLRFDDDKPITDPGQITEILLKDYKKDLSGQKIEYAVLVQRLRKLKEDTIKEINRERTKKGAAASIPKLSKQGQAVLKKLSVVDEELALRFKALASRETLVRSLYESIQDDDFIDKARKIIEGNSGSESKSEKVEKLKRVCWCWIRSNREGKENGEE
ncbi:MAG: SNF2-related protein [Thermoplasmatales archaeon]